MRVRKPVVETFWGVIKKWWSGSVPSTAVQPPLKPGDVLSDCVHTCKCGQCKARYDNDGHVEWGYCPSLTEGYAIVDSGLPCPTCGETLTSLQGRWIASGRSLWIKRRTQCTHKK